jgi:hypothetical protein
MMLLPLPVVPVELFYFYIAGSQMGWDRGEYDTRAQLVSKKTDIPGQD